MIIIVNHVMIYINICIYIYLWSCKTLLLLKHASKYNQSNLFSSVLIND